MGKGIFGNVAENLIDEKAIMDRVDALADRIVTRLLQKMDEYKGLEIRITFEKKTP